jgi:hypothetical protein
MKLRHVPLLLVREMCRHKTHRGLVASTLPSVIQRADELTEFVALYWKDGRQSLCAQAKRGLAAAFQKFDAYQLAKYNRDGAVKLRDVLFLVHGKPRDNEQGAVWKRLVESKLDPPDTWEVALSGGKNKLDTWKRLLAENKLGYLALLRNLRNMDDAGVPSDLVDSAIRERRGADMVLPFRFIAAAKAAPHHEPALDEAMVATMQQAEKLAGKTVVIIDVSGSMYGSRLSAKSDMDRALAGAALGAICRELCETPRIYATAGSDASRIHKTAEVPARRGMALVDAIYGLTGPLGGGGIFLKQVMDYVYDREHDADRVVVITDEQDCGIGIGDAPASARLFAKRHYLINVASCKNGIGYGPWTHIDGWSESVVRFISESDLN